MIVEMISRNLHEEALRIPLDNRAISYRNRILEILEVSKRGHLGPAFSVIEIVDVLYREVMNTRAILDRAETRDRFLLSKGHGCLGLYVVLESLGLLEELNLNTFCSFNSPFGGHPESATIPVIEFSTGSLGHGLPVAVGMAKAAKMKNQKWQVFVLVGDGELNEGSIWEAAAHASKHNLDNLVVIVDYNEMQASGSVKSVLDMEPVVDKWQAFGFETSNVNGHDPIAISRELKRLSKKRQPRCVIAHTVKGKGIPEAENSSVWHHKAKINSSQIAGLKSGLQK
jgi:transketolase